MSSGEVLVLFVAIPLGVITVVTALVMTFAEARVPDGLRKVSDKQALDEEASDASRTLEPAREREEDDTPSGPETT